MNIAELRYVIETAAAGSISGAAKHLGIAQPNISKAIKNLEEEYGIKLFARSSRGVALTREGQGFVNQSRKIVEEIERLKGRFMNDDKNIGRLKIAIPRASYASSAFVEYVRKMTSMEQIQMHIRECNSMDALNCLTSYNYNMAMIRYEIKNEEYYRSMIEYRKMEYENIMDFRYNLLVAENSPLIDRKITCYEDLEDGIELIHGDARLPNGDYTDEMELPENANAKRRIHVYERGSQFALLRGVENSYMWVSPMPEDMLKPYGLTQIECNWQKKWIRDILVYPSSRLLRTEDRIFIEALKKEAKRVSR